VVVLVLVTGASLLGTAGTAHANTAFDDHFNPIFELTPDSGPIGTTFTGYIEWLNTAVVLGEDTPFYGCDEDVNYSVADPNGQEIASGTIPAGMYGHDLGTGYFSFQVTVASPAPLGYYSVSGRCDGEDVYGLFDVTEPAVPVPVPSLSSGATPTVFLGQPIEETATVSHPVSAPGGTMTFTAFTDSQCTHTAFRSAAIPVQDDSASAEFVPVTAGIYYWQASYSGDGTNPALSEPCGTEQSAVSPPRYVALGDSVPYGHGLVNPYPTAQLGLPARATSQAPSSQSYPRLLESMLHLPMTVRSKNCSLTGDDLAISGATAAQANVKSGNQQCQPGWADSQSVEADELPAAQIDEDHLAELVTIQAGADDIHFADCLTYELTRHGTSCVTSNGSVTPAVSRELTSVRSAITSEIETISPDVAHIAVLDYYQPVPSPASYDPASAVTLHGQVDLVCSMLQKPSLKGKVNPSSDNVYRDAQAIQSALNAAIRNAVLDARDAGVQNVQFIDISSLENDHGMCTSRPAVFAGEQIPATQLVSDLRTLAVCAILLTPSCTAADTDILTDISRHLWRVAHPNASGQNDIAQVIRTQVGDLPR
jgi:hypothetical protein